MLWVAHIAFGACIAGTMIFWACTDDGRSAGFALLVVGAISTALVLEIGRLHADLGSTQRVLIEFYEVGGTAVILVLAWRRSHSFGSVAGRNSSANAKIV